MLALLLGEVVARFVVNPNDFLQATMVDDPVLRHRVKPHTTGHDALGFRNPDVPERAAVIAIGDSMTYGFGVTRDNSWPYQFGRLLHEPVYNMGLGGYGPLQYLYLIQNQANKLKPKLLLVGFYLGNDLADAYSIAHRQPYWHGWRESEAGAAVETGRDRAVKSEPKRRFEGLRNWLSRNSVIYSMLRVAVFPQFALREQDGMASQVSQERQMIWNDPAQLPVRTIFTPQLRLSALDLQEAAGVREGLGITKRAFAAMKTEADTQGAQLLFVLIPTKERVYYRYLKASGTQIPTAFTKACDNEDMIKKDIVHFFSEKGIAYVDVAGDLEKMAREHIQIYPMDSDGHPQATGQGVIANAVYDAVRRHHFDAAISVK